MYDIGYIEMMMLKKNRGVFFMSNHEKTMPYGNFLDKIA